MDLNSDDFLSENNFDYMLKPSWWNYFPSIVVLPAMLFGMFYLLGQKTMFELPNKTLIVIGMSIIVLLIILVSLISRYFTTLYLHHDYLIYKKGIFPRLKKISLADIRTVDVDFSPIGKLLDFGKLKLATAGTDGYELISTNFNNPIGIIKYLNDHRTEGL